MINVNTANHVHNHRDFSDSSNILTTLNSPFNSNHVRTDYATSSAFSTSDLQYNPGSEYNVYIAEDRDGNWGLGHTGVIIEKPNNSGFLYYSKEGLGADAEMKESIYCSNQAIRIDADSLDDLYAKLEDAVKTGYNEDREGNRYEKYCQLTLDGAQMQKMYAFLEDDYNTNYNVFSNNCMHLVRDSLLAAGISVPKAYSQPHNFHNSVEKMSGAVVGDFENLFA